MLRSSGTGSDCAPSSSDSGSTNGTWGVVVLVGATAAGAAHAVGLVPALVIGLVGVWLVAKDWSDLTRTRRDTAAWRLGIHRRPLRLRPFRRLDDVPGLAALAVAIVGLVDLVSAVTPNMSWRGRVLVHVEPVAAMRAAHALAVPVSFALIVTAYYLYRRRSRALHVALALLATLAVFNLVKGLDVEETALTVAAAALLWASRSSFYVRHEPATLRSSLWQVPLLLAGAFLLSLAAVALAAPPTASPGDVVRATGDLLLWQPAPFAFRDELARTGLAVELTGLLALLAAAYLLFRPLAAPRDLPDPELRRAAARARARARRRYARVLQAARRQAVPLQPREDGVPRLPDRERGADDLRRPGRRAGVGREPDAGRRALRRAARAQARCARRQRDGACALRAGRPARPLHRGRGDRRHRAVQPRRTRDPEGAAVGLAPAQRRLSHRARRARLARRRRRRAPGAGRARLARGRAGARLQHGHGLASQPAGRARRSSSTRATTTARSAASSTSCRPTAAAPCRSRSCAASPRRRTA